MDLIVGKFYWVIPVLDPDANEEWEHHIQPARFAGYKDSKPLWHMLNVEGSIDWPMRFVDGPIMCDFYVPLVRPAGE